MGEKLKNKPCDTDNQNGNECRHHWLIEAANGPKSLGTCSYCGENRYFYNSVPDLAQLKRGPNPLNLPKMKDVEIDKESQS